jgi:hypothetical protein
MTVIHEYDGRYVQSSSSFVDEVFDRKNIGELAELVKKAKAQEAAGNKEGISLELANDVYKVTGDTTPLGLAKTVAYHRIKQRVSRLTPNEIGYLETPKGEIANIGGDLHTSTDNPNVGFASAMDTNFAIVARAAQATQDFQKALEGPHARRNTSQRAGIS